MKAIRKFTVRAVVPDRLTALEELAANLRWSWHEPIRRLFEHVSVELWASSGHDPVALLGAVPQERLAELAADDDFVDWTNRMRDELRAYLTEPRWYQSLEGATPAGIAYFSPEFGIAEALPQYSGGLGILAGDHLKSASDLGVPLVGVGLFYRAGYFAQSISADGWQVETYPLLDPDGLPLSVLRHHDGSPVHVTLALPDDRSLHARVLQAMVGRVTLLLLDTDIPENDEALRSVTDRLYGGGGEHRLLQELLLGIGGVRAVDQFVDLTGRAAPDVFHTNEGHAGFLGLERISDLIGDGLTFDEALQVVRAGTVFTTHTPVPAGIDRFDRPLIARYFDTELLPGIHVDDVLALGAEPGPDGDPGVFNMAVMGLRLGQRANGVSELHGQVSRTMFGALWPGFDSDDVPIDSITNGVHAPTWTDPALLDLADRMLGTTDTTGADWLSPALSDAELWSVKRRMRRQLVEDARRRVRQAWCDQHPGGTPPEWMSELLDPDTLTIGFARRVPTYKRLTLMLRDPERLKAILTSADRPVQFVVAGKSHPADDEGKRLIQRLVQFASDPELRTRMVFLPDYDIGMAQVLYPGCDVWLNTPLRPLEACGTSGMKAALNGALNLSILDGWWAEYFDGENGWAIPTADAAGDAAERDDLESAALYDLIEHRVATQFYERNGDGVPERWVGAMRHTLAILSPELSADRMVREYVERLYRPAGENARELTADGFRAARELAAWNSRLVEAWPSVAVVHVASGGVAAVPHVGEELGVRAQVQLGGLAADDVTVEVVYGRSDNGQLRDVRSVELRPAVEARRVVSPPVGDSTAVDSTAVDPTAVDSGAVRLYTGTVVLDGAGGFGYTVRIVPRHALLANPAETGLVALAG